MSYTRYDNYDGTVQCKVVMADFDWPHHYEVFYTYGRNTSSGSYDWPDNWAPGMVIGSYYVTWNQYFCVVSDRGTEELAHWVSTYFYDWQVYQSGGVLGVTPVIREEESQPPSGDGIYKVSNQITGDYSVHTYLYQQFPGGTTDRKIRVRNTKTGGVWNFTHEDLQITDKSPLSSATERWKLLSAIGVFDKIKETK